MTELLYKKRKGDIPPPEPVHIGEIQDPLLFWTSEAAEVDLRVFATGLTAEMIESVGGSRNGKWVPFKGRPDLIAELAPYIRQAHSKAVKGTIGTLLVSLRWWWRLFDTCDGIAEVKTVKDLNQLHYAGYRVNPCSRCTANRFLTVVHLARKDQSLTDLNWTVIREQANVASLIQHEDVKQLYHYLQQLCKKILIDWDAYRDRLEENRAGDVKLHTSNEPRWLFNPRPKKADVENLFAFFILMTGWNSAVAGNIDMSLLHESGELAGKPACLRPYSQNPDQYWMVESVKVRAGGVNQTAVGRIKQRLSSVNIILALYQQTEPLREIVKSELAALKSKDTTSLTVTEKGQLGSTIADYEQLVRSPWLYEARTRLGVAAVTVASVARGNIGPLGRAITAINAQNSGPKLTASRITLSDLRDAFISYRWEKGGFAWLDTMLAAGHSSMRSLQHYLNKKQHLAASRKDYLVVQDAVWYTIEHLPATKAATFPTLVAARSRGISEEQIVHWLDGKDRTYLGVGCKDITAPPRTIDPQHRDGTICRVQRCTLCEHAVLLPDSYIGIARRVAELEYIHTSIGILAWAQSDFVEELSTAHEAIKNFDASVVEQELVKWRGEILNGNHVPLTMEGSYE